MASSVDFRALYRPQTEPFAHQWTALERGCMKWVFGFLTDPGTGKSKMIIDNAAFLYERGVIDGMLLYSPNDVHDQWMDEQFPLHWPRRHALRHAVWHANGHKARRLCQELVSHPLPDRFTVLAMNHDSIATSQARKLAVTFCKTYKVMLVFDESHYFKTPKASRTKTATHTLRPLVKVVRIATGTFTDLPFDVYAQMRLLDERILQFDSFLAFKHHYGEFTTEFTHRFNHRTKKKELTTYETLANYRNLDELYARIAPYVYICRKEDCTDLPPKIYSERRCHLSEAQQELYDQVKNEGIALIEAAEAGQQLRVANLPELDEDSLLSAITDPGQRMTVTIKLVLCLRLQQIAGGFFTTDDGRVHSVDGLKDFPRARDTVALVKDIRGKVIIWAEFRAELKYLERRLIDEHHQTALIFGDTPRSARQEILTRFKNPQDPLRILVAHRKTMGTGQNLQVAQDEIFYSNGPSSIARTQCEDRTHRIGQTGTVNIWDLIAAPCDRVRLDSLKAKKNLTDTLLHMTARQLQEAL